MESTAQPASVFPAAAQEVPSLGVEGDALIEEVKASVGTLRRLMEHSDLLGKDAYLALRHTAARVVQRLNRTELSVVVAGERGAGKRTFLDALIGDRRVGEARGRAAITTFVRHGVTPHFRARLTDGTVEDFASLVPDRQRAMDQRLVAAEQELELAQNHAAALALRLESTREGIEREQVELEAANQAAAGTHQVARAMTATIARAEETARETAQRFAELEGSVPRPLQAPPANLGFGSWLGLLVYRVVFWGSWKRFAEARRLRDEAAERLFALQHRTDEWEHAREEASARVSSLTASLAARREQVRGADSVMADAEAKVSRAEKALGEMKRELGRYVEERQERFFSELSRVAKKGERVAQLDIAYPADFVPDGVAIIDAPDVNEGGSVWQVISEEADGCILISELERGVSGETARFLERLREVVPHVLLVLSKIDAAFVEAHGRGSADPWQDVESARRASTRRFAEQIGRSPETVLSIAVSARAVLFDPESDLARRFEEEVRKLLRLLRHERALILGARAATVLRRCIADIKVAEARADAAYRERIATLEAEQVPEPEVFHQKALAEAEKPIRKAAAQAISHSTDAAHVAFAQLRRDKGDLLRARTSSGQFRAAALGTEQGLAAEVQKIQTDALLALDSSAEQSISDIERGVFAELARRYHIAEAIESTRRSFQSIDLALPGIVAPTQGKIGAVLARHATLRVALAALGVLVGGALGYLIRPGLGAAVGAALGVLLMFAKTRRSLERATITALELALRKQESDVVRTLESFGARTQATLHDAVNRSIENVIIRYGRYIAEPFAAGEEALARERAALGELLEIESLLETHDARLGELLADAAKASRGLAQ